MLNLNDLKTAAAEAAIGLAIHRPTLQVVLMVISCTVVVIASILTASPLPLRVAPGIGGGPGGG